MELVILLVVVIGVLGWFIWKDAKNTVNGTHPLDGATKMLDVNNDGRVDLQDAVAAAEVVVEKTKKTATKAKVAAKKTVAKAKAAVKKPAVKKPKK